MIMSSGNSRHAVDPNLFTPQPTLPYTHFAPMEGSWNPIAYDPSLMPFGFGGASLMSGQPQQVGFIFYGPRQIWQQVSGGRRTQWLLQTRSC